MKHIFGILSLLCVWLAGQLPALAQVQYRVALDADKVTYRVFMTSAVSYTGTQAQIATAQVTLVVPHGTGADRFRVTNQVNKQVGDDEMKFSLNSRVDAPCVDASRAAGSGYAACTSSVGNTGTTFTGVTAPFDYLSFGYNGTGTSIRFDILAGEEIELFSFRNPNNCLGPVALFENPTDPFRSPNSQNNNPGNQITILGANGDIYRSNAGGSADCRVPAPDLTASIGGPASVLAGGAASFSLTVTNVGTAVSSGQVNVTTILPAGISYVGSTGAGWACTPSVGSTNTTLVNCVSSAAIAGNGGTGGFGLNVTAASSLAAGTSLTLTGSVAGGGETNLNNNGFSRAITIQAAAGVADLSAGIAGPASIMAGTGAAYTISVNNVGNAASSGSISTATTLPAGMNFVSASGTGWSYIPTIQPDNSTLVNCTYTGTINAGASAPALTLNVLAGLSLAGNTISIGGSVAGGGETNTTNNNYSQSVMVTAPGVPDLTATLSGPSPVQAGSQTNYTLTVNNIGAGASVGPVIANTTLPAGLGFVSSGGTNWACSGAGQPNGTTPVSCTYTGSINANAAAPALTLTLLPASSLGGSTVGINGSVAGGGETNTANNAYGQSMAVLATPATGAADLSATLTGPASLSSGATGAFVLTVNNNGTATTSGVTSTTTNLPNGLTLNGFGGAGWACTTLTPVGGNTPVVCTNSAMVPVSGSFAPLSLSVTATNNSTTNQPVTLSGNVRGTGETNLSNNGYSTGTTLLGAQTRPDLALTGPGPVSKPGGSSSPISFSVGNTGSAATTGPISLTATLPAGVLLNSTSGTGWACGSTGGQSGQPTTVVCTYADPLPPQTNAPALVLTVTPSSSLTGTTVNIPAIVNTAGETNLGNNSFTASINVTNTQSQRADLSTKISVDTRTPAPGSPVITTVVVTNGGPATAQGIVTQVTLPAGVPIGSSSATNGSFDAATGRWSVGTLTVGQSATLTIGLTAGAAGISYLTNEIIASNLPDPNSTPNNGNEAEDDFDRTCFTTPLVVCAGDAYVISVPVAATVAVQWYRNGQVIAGATSYTLSVTESGTYTVTTTNQKCPAEGCCPMIVQMLPPAVLTLGPGSKTNCGTFDLRTVAVLADGQPVATSNLSYYTTEADARAMTNPTLPVISVSGAYWVRYQNPAGCVSVMSVAVTVLPRPNTPLVAGTLASVCPAVSVNLTAAQPAPSLAGSTFEWHVGNTTSSALVSDATMAPAGTYYLFERSNNGCYNSMPSVPVTVTITACCKPNICVPMTISRVVRKK